MSKRGLIVLAVALVALFAALVFLVREARDGGEDQGQSATRVRADRKQATSADSEKAEKSGERPARQAPDKPAPPSEVTKSIKTASDGREYVETLRPDGSKLRDYRKTAVKEIDREERMSGPRLIEKNNAVALQRGVRSKVWGCVQKHYDAVMALPGIDKVPVVVVWTRTKAEAEVTVTGVEVEIEADEQHPETARCIEGALVGATSKLAPGVEQKPYEDFEVPMRFRVPPPKRATSSP